MAFSPMVRSFGSLFTLYFVVNALIGFVCFIGMWKMRKWGVLLYTLAVIICQLALMKVGLWSPFAVVIPAIVVAIGFYYFPKMR